MLVGAEPQRPRQRVDDLGRRRDLAALFQPGVPGDAYPGQLGDFLAAQAGRPAPAGLAVTGQPDVGGSRPGWRERRKSASWPRLPALTTPAG